MQLKKCAIYLILAISGLTVGCDKKTEAVRSKQKTEIKSSIDLNENQLKFVLTALLDRSVEALRGHGTDAEQAKARHNYNILQVVDARNLAKQYNENEVAADQKFKKKGAYILVTGTVSKISKDFKGEPYVSLAGSDMFNTVQAKFGNADLDALTKLKSGQKTEIVCEVSNKIVTTVILHECATIETHTQDQRASIGAHYLEVMEGKKKSSQEGAEGMAAMYLISKQLRPDSACFTKIDSECEKEFVPLVKKPQSIENQAAFKSLINKWTNGG